MKAKRFYAHCDLIEGTRDVYYCSFCNKLVKEQHFNEEHLTKNHANKFLATLNEWKEKVARGNTRVRPADAPNRIQGAEALGLENPDFGGYTIDRKEGQSKGAYGAHAKRKPQMKKRRK